MLELNKLKATHLWLMLGLESLQGSRPLREKSQRWMLGLEYNRENHQRQYL